MQIHEKVEGARIAGAAIGVSIYGMTLNECVAIVTIFYLLLQSAILIAKLIKVIQIERGKKNAK